MDASDQPPAGSGDRVRIPAGAPRPGAIWRRRPVSRNYISYVGPVYLSVFPVPPGTKNGLSWSWTTSLTGRRGAGVALHAGLIGIAVGVFSARLQERLIPHGAKEYRLLGGTEEPDWVFDLEGDMVATYVELEF